MSLTELFYLMSKLKQHYHYELAQRLVELPDFNHNRKERLENETQDW